MRVRGLHVAEPHERAADAHKVTADRDGSSRNHRRTAGGGLGCIGCKFRNGDAVSERAVDVLVNRLRRKIEQNPANPIYVQTVRGLGYRLVVS